MPIYRFKVSNTNGGKLITFYKRFACVAAYQYHRTQPQLTKSPVPTVTATTTTLRFPSVRRIIISAWFHTYFAICF